MILDLNSLEQKFAYLLKKSTQFPHRFIGHQGISIKQIQYHSSDYLKAMFKSYKDGQFAFNPANRILVKSDKERWVFQYTLPDLLIHYCLADHLKKLIDPVLSDNLYSYRKGRNSNQVLSHVDQYIRRYRKNYAGELKQRGLYVIRKDITKYTDSIATHESSHLIKKITNLFSDNQSSLSIYDKTLLVKSLNPDYIKIEMGKFLDSGTYHFLPTGSPLSNVLGNFYLNDLDHEMSAIKNSFYIRFGDDILFMTEDLDTFKTSLKTIESHCTQLGLSFNQNKSYNLFLNGCGRSHNSIQGTANFNYLGAKIDFNEGVLLASKKKKILFNLLRRELSNYQNHATFFQATEQDLIDGINKKLNLRKNNIYIYLDFLIQCVSSRNYLSQIDRDIAFEILKILKKDKSMRVFRNHGYRTLRRDKQLISLVCQKNMLHKYV